MAGWPSCCQPLLKTFISASKLDTFLSSSKVSKGQQKPANIKLQLVQKPNTSTLVINTADCRLLQNFISKSVLQYTTAKRTLRWHIAVNWNFRLGVQQSILGQWHSFAESCYSPNKYIQYGKMTRSAYGLSNIKWRNWVWMTAAYRQTYGKLQLALSEGQQPLETVFYVHQMN